jgi:hypothetical protein
MRGNEVGCPKSEVSTPVWIDKLRSGEISFSFLYQKLVGFLTNNDTRP